MKARYCLMLVLALRAIAAAPVQWEAGVSYFLLRQARFEQTPPPISVDEHDRAAPFVGVTARLTNRFALRFSYHFIDNVRATAKYSFRPGDPPSPIPIVVFGHYDDDVHLLSLAPELAWPVTPRLTFALAPQLNWVASRATIRYATTNALILLVAPQRRNEDGFTLGGGVRMQWAVSRRATVLLGYQFVDFQPSFDRQAHVLSGGIGWTF